MRFNLVTADILTFTPIPSRVKSKHKTDIKEIGQSLVYPVDALPSPICEAVSTYHNYGQQPLSLIACSALANVSLACQCLANVARDRMLISPVSLYFLVIAGSGVLFFATLFSKSCPKLCN